MLNSLNMSVEDYSICQATKEVLEERGFVHKAE